MGFAQCRPILRQLLCCSREHHDARGPLLGASLASVADATQLLASFSSTTLVAVIESERLIIRLPEAADVSEVIRYYRDNRAYLQPYSPTFPSEFLDERTWLDQVKIRAQEMAAGDGLRAFIFVKVAPRTVVGNINLTQVQRGSSLSCVLGYNLGESEQGKGYMTEAVRAVVDFAFRTWGLHRVAASHMPNNVRSAEVLRRCGFEREGYARHYLKINGRWEDHILTAIRNPSP